MARASPVFELGNFHWRSPRPGTYWLGCAHLVFFWAFFINEHLNRALARALPHDYGAVPYGHGGARS